MRLQARTPLGRIGQRHTRQFERAQFVGYDPRVMRAGCSSPCRGFFAGIGRRALRR
jgi:branched-chain amino acid transport system permease protein